MKPTLQRLGLVAGALFLFFSLTGCPGPEGENTPPDAKTDRAKISATALEEETSEEENDITIEDTSDPFLEPEEESEILARPPVRRPGNQEQQGPDDETPERGKGPERSGAPELPGQWFLLP